MTKVTKYSHLTDPELVVLIKQNQEYLGEVYRRCKQYSISFLRKMTGNKLQDYELEDVYHDSILILYEKILKTEFILTASLQVYLNSVCRFQMLNKLKDDKRNIVIDDGDSDNKSVIFDETDNDEVEIAKKLQNTALEKALELMKQDKGHCYELLTQFWYHKKSMNELTAIFGYSNAANAKNQKSRCQERLRKMSFNEMNAQ
jgi:RNA polymerase sigma factor (sigma-70 family)